MPISNLSPSWRSEHNYLNLSRWHHSIVTVTRNILLKLCMKNIAYFLYHFPMFFINFTHRYLKLIYRFISSYLKPSLDQTLALEDPIIPIPIDPNLMQMCIGCSFPTSSLSDKNDVKSSAGPNNVYKSKCEILSIFNTKYSQKFLIEILSLYQHHFFLAFPPVYHNDSVIF